MNRRERNFCAEIHTRNNRPVRFRTRCYASFDNAIRGASLWAARDLRVQEMVVLYHLQTGLELGTIKCSLDGRLVSHFIFDDEE